MSGIKIDSDFKDYYDYLNDESSAITYHRRYGDCAQRGTALRKLQNLGIRTIEIKQVSKFIYSSKEKLVVYTDPMLHNGKGKRVMCVDEARQSYINYIASKYYDECKEFIKLLQVGKRRFVINYKRADEFDLSKNEITNITEISSELNNAVALPIFSVDYISIDSAMVATDFNEVEVLRDCGVAEILRPEEVIEEIKNSLVAYNKA